MKPRILVVDDEERMASVVAMALARAGYECETCNGGEAALQRLMEWHGIDEMAEAMTLMIHNVEALGKDGSAAIMSVPRHEIAISPSVARRLQSEGRKAKEDDDDAESA